MLTLLRGLQAAILNTGHRIVLTLLTADCRVAEFQSGITLIGIGLWFMDPRFLAFSGARDDVYWFLARMWGENVWGMIFCLIGVVQLISVWSGTLALRAPATFAAFILWFTMSHLFITAKMHLLGEMAWPAYATVQLFCYLSSSSRHRGLMIEH